MKPDSSATNHLLRRVAEGDREGWGVLLLRHGARLRRLVAHRLDARLHGRLDPDDVVQEVFLAASRHPDAYRSQAGVPFFLWLRGVAANKLLELHRHHLGTPMRDARREVPTSPAPSPDTSSSAPGARIPGRTPGPSEAAIRAEARLRLREAVGRLGPADREVLALRHFQHLTNAEAARMLGISEAAAGKRYLRALERLRESLAPGPGDLDP